ncbi:Ccaat-binding transcription factor [Entamoeba marina]
MNDPHKSPLPYRDNFMRGNDVNTMGHMPQNPHYPPHQYYYADMSDNKLPSPLHYQFMPMMPPHKPFARHPIADPPISAVQRRPDIEFEMDKVKPRPPIKSPMENKFWKNRMEETEKRDLKTKQFPPARIRKMMKSTIEKKHVKTETVEILSRACELFIMDLTTRARTITGDAKRKVIKKEDIVDAITGTDNGIFDFLVDFLPQN